MQRLPHHQPWLKARTAGLYPPLPTPAASGQDPACDKLETRRGWHQAAEPQAGGKPQSCRLETPEVKDGEVTLRFNALAKIMLL